ncbi:rod shape-determining protein MreC [Parapedobacter defluvii]|uniref:Cell shape-determining protein MreC n=1 Tax=Parapedobacter defluvii TaxID=2045106 RepID=A0ABQ1LVZ9_9SPHI|nr:rod shape-determining protein MreC [Parapedobacter defluvii]RQP11603.1 MAG: rod shape-determining protein MreC [Parapedobacter sp.]GGC29038.1 rod shape-determining protein MreC [Parapedobacter defluvii]
MKNLWLILTKYNAFFFFVVFFVFAYYLVVQNNTFQRASAVNSSNELVGAAYAKINGWKSYLHLSEDNALLAEENARLKEQLQRLMAPDSLEQGTVVDSSEKVQYHYIVAKVTNNSIHQKNNYITLDKGRIHGIKKGMGVISASGIVGIVLNVSDHFSTVQSLLHSETRVSAALEDSKAFGSLTWGDSYDAQVGTLKDIPNHVKVRKGEAVFTSGFSLFPPGIPIGRVIQTGVSGGDSFLDIKIELSTQFHNLQHVYVVDDILAAERTELESQNENNG